MNEFEQDLNDLIEGCIQDAGDEVAEEAIDNLKGALNSTEAKEFAEHANKIFRKNGTKDKSGNYQEVDVPDKAASSISMDGTDGSIKISDNEDKWFRANKLYGNNMLGEIGFKYKSEK